MKNKLIKILSIAVVGVMTITGCSTVNDISEDLAIETVFAEEADTDSESQVTVIDEADAFTSEESVSGTTTTGNSVETGTISETSTVTTVDGSILDTSEMFTERDLEQTADLSEAVNIELTSGDDLVINEEGVYLISGDVTDVSIIVEADDEAKVQLVLDGVSIVNEDAPAIYVKSADKVFVTTTDSENYLEVSGYFSADGDTNLDAVIFSRSDLVLNGVGSLGILSMEGNGVTSKDDLKITGGTILVAADQDGFEANDSIRVYDGDIQVTANKDGFHSENDEDNTLGYIYIYGGDITVNSADDAIHATTVIQIDGGTINIPNSSEGIEATYIQINGGYIDIYATDDAINAANKSDYDVVIEVNGGLTNVEVSSGDTDAFDANGVVILNGGEVNVTTPNSSFDADAGVTLTDATVTVNGETVTDVTAFSGKQGGTKRR